MWGRAVPHKQQLNFRQYIFKWEHRNQISDNQHIWKKFASPTELQKQWGTRSSAKAEAVATAVEGEAGQPGEGEEAGSIQGESRKPGQSGHIFLPGLLCSLAPQGAV